MELSDKCRYCGGSLKLGPGKGPHYASYLCNDCGRNCCWAKDPNKPPADRSSEIDAVNRELQCRKGDHV